MTKKKSLQDPFLNILRRDQIQIFIYLVNGIKLQGHVESFDQFVILLKNNTINQMVYKHAISTIVPSRPMLQYNHLHNDSSNSNIKKKIDWHSVSTEK